MESEARSIVLRGRRIGDHPFERTVSTDARELSLEGIGLTELDLAPLASCRALERLELSRNALDRIEVDLAPLRGHPSLRRLDLSGDITMASSEPTVGRLLLTELPALEELDLYLNAMTTIDLGPLSSSAGLRRLDLSWNHLESLDLGPLAVCTKLEALCLHVNRLASLDLGPLAGLEGLQRWSSGATQHLPAGESTERRPLVDDKVVLRLASSWRGRVRSPAVQKLVERAEIAWT